jgi:hypothetical protein
MRSLFSTYIDPMIKDLYLSHTLSFVFSNENLIFIFNELD